MTCAEANKNAKTANTTKQEKNVMVMWSLHATSSSLYGHFMVNRVQNLFTKSTWRSVKWTGSTAKLERGVRVVDKNTFRSNLVVSFWNFQKFPRRPRSDKVLCGSGHELIPVDREARKKLRDVNKYWILATTRKNMASVWDRLNPGIKPEKDLAARWLFNIRTGWTVKNY